MNGMSYKMAFGLEMLRQMETSGEITEETIGSIDLSVVPEKNKAFYEEDRTAASATPAPGDAAGRTDGTELKGARRRRIPNIERKVRDKT